MKLPQNHPYNMYEGMLASGRKGEIMLHYFNKYFQLFMQSRTITGLSYEQEYFTKMFLWDIGTLMCFKIDESDLPPVDAINNVAGTNTLVFCLYAPNGWNHYHFVNRCHAVNTRGVNFIDTTRVFIPNEDCVLLWCNTAHTSPKLLIRPYIARLADLWCAYDMNLYVNTQPKLVGVAPEDFEAVKDVEKKIARGEKVIFTGLNDSHAVVPLIEGSTNYILDKLSKEIQEIENKILTILGIKNVSFEKQERITDEEATGSQSETQLLADSVNDTISEGLKKINELFGTNLQLVDNGSPIVYEEIMTDIAEDTNNEDKE